MPGYFSHRFAVLTLLIAAPAFASAQEKPLREVIKTEIIKGWQQEKVTPAAPSSDSVFLRRVYLDLVGSVPSYDETMAFLKDADPQKRTKLIDKLLADSRYASQQAHVWDLVLFGRHPQNIDATRKRDGFKNWMTEQFAKNEPWDKIAKKLLMAEEEGSELFYVQYRNATEG